MGKEKELFQAAAEGNVWDIEKILNTSRSSIGISFRRPTDVNCQDPSGFTALHHASLHGRKEVVELLLRHGASTTIPDLQGNCPLHFAAWGGFEEIVEILLNKGPSRANVKEKNVKRETALHVSAQYGHHKVIPVLIECGADPLSRNAEGLSALDLAAQFGRLETVQELLKFHPQLVHHVGSDTSPLHLASRNGHVNVVDFLIRSGMDIDYNIIELGTPLHEAALFGKEDVVKVLLENGVDISAKNSAAQTVIDVLASLPTEKSSKITSLIYTYLQKGSKKVRSKSDREMATPENSTYDIVSAPKHNSVATEFVVKEKKHLSQRDYQGSTYNDVPTPRLAGTIEKTIPEVQQSVYDQVPHPVIPPPYEVPPPRKTSLYDDVPPPVPSRLSGTGYEINRAQTERKRDKESRGHKEDWRTRSSSESRPDHPQLPEGYKYSTVDLSAKTKYGHTLPPIPAPRTPPTKRVSIEPEINPHVNQTNLSPSSYDIVGPPIPVDVASNSSTEQPRPFIVKSQTPSEPLGQYNFLAAPSHMSTLPSKENSGSIPENSCNSTYDFAASPHQSTPPQSSISSDYACVEAPTIQRQASRNIPIESSLYDYVAPIHKTDTGKPSSLGDGHITGSSTLDNSSDVTNIPSTSPVDTLSWTEQIQSGGIYDVVTTLPRKNLPDMQSGNPSAGGVYDVAAPVANPFANLHSSQPGDWEPQIYDSITNFTSGQKQLHDQPENVDITNENSQESSAYEVIIPKQPVIQQKTSRMPSANGGSDYEVISNTYRLPPQAAQASHDEGGAYEVLSIPTASQRNAANHPVVPQPQVVQLPPQMSKEHNRTPERQRKPYYGFAQDERPEARSVAPGLKGLAESGAKPKRHHNLYEEMMQPQGAQAIVKHKETPTKPPRQQVKPIQEMGDYCTLAEARSVVRPPSDSSSSTTSLSTSSSSDSIYDVPSPLFSPPSPNTANKSIREVLKPPPYQPKVPSISEQGHNASPPLGPVPKPRSHKPPAPTLLYENVLFGNTELAAAKVEEEHQPEDVVSSEVPARVNSREYQGRPESGKRLSALSPGAPLDENSEFVKIEQFLSDIYEGVHILKKDPKLAHPGNETTASPPGNINSGDIDSVADWLACLGLDEYESMLILNGFDRINFIGAGILEDYDLIEMMMYNAEHRRKILDGVSMLPNPPFLDPAYQEPESVQEWLHSLSLIDYYSSFSRNDYITMDKVKGLWEMVITSVIGIETIGHKKRIMASLKTLQSSEQPFMQNMSWQGFDSGVDTDLDELQAHFASLSSDLSLELDQPKQTSPPSTVQNTEPCAREQTPSLPTPEQAPGNTPVPVKRERTKSSQTWKHDNKLLLEGNVNFNVQYLGFHAVTEITGSQATIAACEKIRVSSQNIQKVPSVVLSISVTGVRVIDAQKKVEISQHPISNISYCTQDAVDKKIFAYISRDEKSLTHFCHVFRVTNSTISDDVMMTLGQAFKLAYEIFSAAQD